MAEITRETLQSKELTLVANPQHPDMRQRPHLKGTYRYRDLDVNGTNIRDVIYSNDSPDIIFNVHDVPQSAQDFITRNNWQILPQNDVNAFSLLIDTQAVEPDLLKAIKYILYQQEITSRNIGNTSMPIARLFTHTSQLEPFNNPYAIPDHTKRLGEARAILRKLGISPRTMRIIKAAMTLGLGDARIPPIIQGLLREEGIDLQIAFIGQSEGVFEVARAKQVDAVFAAWFVAIPHPSGFFFHLNWSPLPLLSPAQRDELNTIISLPADVAHDDQAVRKAYHSAEEYLIAHGGIIPLMKALRFVIHRREICGVVGSASRSSPLMWMYVCD